MKHSKRKPCLWSPDRHINTIVKALYCWILLFCTGREAAFAAEQYDYISPDGYRMQYYRAPTPPGVEHGVTIDTEALVELIASEKPILIDVLSVVVRPELAEFGMSWLPNETRYHIPGSVWLPNVGFGELDAHIENYFRSNLHRLTDGKLDKAIVFYCVRDCWMSWNAIKRAASFGYRRLYWYPEGTDGWREHDLELIEGEPVPL